MTANGEEGRCSDLRHDPRSSPELVAAIQAQWDAIAVLMRANVLHEVGQTWKGSPLFWGVEGPLREHPPLWPADARPRWEGLPVFVLSLPMAMDLARIELLMTWLATALSGRPVRVENEAGDGQQ